MKRYFIYRCNWFIFVVLIHVAQIKAFVRNKMPALVNLMTPDYQPFTVRYVSSQQDTEQKVDVSELLRNVQELVDQTSSMSCTDKKAILSRMDERHQADCIAARVLAMEQDKSVSIPPPDYEWIYARNHSLAIQSIAPILNATDITTLLDAAEDYWQHADSAESRFTYQKVGNSEVHVSDLGEEAKQVMNRVLRQSVYPLVRDAFGNFDKQESNLCVYDSLMIRYNATEASNGAGQPLHRDLGIVSVNIMLNDPDEFDGGGTFFENQMRETDPKNVAPLKPLGKGHSLAHYSTERHAGAATIDGVRDILVIFVMAQQDNDVTPRLIQNARLKQCARKDCEEQCGDNGIEAILCRIQHQLLAIEAVPNDGETFQYLGAALMDLAGQSAGADERNSILSAAIECLRHAAILTPCDSRVYNNLGLAFSKQCEGDFIVDSSVVNAYEKTLEILERSRIAGCDVENEYDTVSLNYGLYLSNLDQFTDSCRVLEHTAAKNKVALENKESTSRVIDDAYRLWEFCYRNMPG